MKKISAILLIIFILILLPALIFDFAPREIVAVLDMGIFSPYVNFSVFFATLLYSLMGTALWAAVSVIYTAVCMGVAGKRGELTPLYGCLMPTLCIITIVCHIAAADFAKVAAGV